MHVAHTDDDPLKSLTIEVESAYIGIILQRAGKQMRKQCDAICSQRSLGFASYLHFIVVYTILRPHDPVPEGEIEPEMLILVGVMNGMVSWADYPSAKPVMGKANGELFRSKVIDNGPNGHCR